MNMASVRSENVDEDAIADLSWKKEKTHFDELAWLWE
jgi:hypothetical protein